MENKNPKNNENCGICLDKIKDNTILICLHNFCKKCIVSWEETRIKQELSISCPICRTIYKKVYLENINITVNEEDQNIGNSSQEQEDEGDDSSEEDSEEERWHSDWEYEDL